MTTALAFPAAPPPAFIRGYADLIALGLVTDAHWRTETEFAFRVSEHRNGRGELIKAHTCVLVREPGSWAKWERGMDGWVEEWEGARGVWEESRL